MATATRGGLTGCVLAAAVWLGGVGCAPVRLPPGDLDPSATFAAHQIHEGFLIDRLRAGGTGIVEPAPFLHLSGAPEYRVRVDRATVGTVRLLAPAAVELRETSLPEPGEVEPAWDDGAIRLTVRADGGRPLRVGPFRRIGGSGYSVLSRNAQTVLDVRGTYRAPVVDERGVTMGWWEVRIAEPYGPRLFQGVLPDVSATEGAGVTVALDSEVDWIVNHTLDVYRGTSSGHVLDRSPGGR